MTQVVPRQRVEGLHNQQLKDRTALVAQQGVVTMLRPPCQQRDSPDFNAEVAAARVQPLVVSGERQRKNRAGVTIESGGVGVVGQSPELDASIVASTE